jgi:CxxC-x17-CxxC domain-containing protein
MDDQDSRIQCVDCGEEFLFTAGEQAFYREKGLTHAPTRCKSCREKRKHGARPGGEGMARRGGSGGHAAAGPRFTATCSNCGAETQVPFQPVSGRPVYCRNCYQDKKGTRAPSAPRSGGARHGSGSEPRRSPAPRSTATSTTGRASGAVKWFNEEKGFGFIVEDGGADVFVHMSALQEAGIRTLAEGDRVEFDIMPGAKGKQATNVAKLD